MSASDRTLNAESRIAPPFAGGLERGVELGRAPCCTRDDRRRGPGAPARVGRGVPTSERTPTPQPLVVAGRRLRAGAGRLRPAVGARAAQRRIAGDRDAVVVDAGGGVRGARRGAAAALHRLAAPPCAGLPADRPARGGG